MEITYKSMTYDTDKPSFCEIKTSLLVCAKSAAAAAAVFEAAVASSAKLVRDLFIFISASPSSPSNTTLRIQDLNLGIIDF